MTLFFFLKNTDDCNFADDTTPFVCDENLEVIVRKLEENSDLAISWFQNNYMKLNTDKCHLLKYEHIWAQIGKDKIWEDNEVKLFRVTIDNGLNLDTHINSICKKANQKLSVLSRMRCILNFQ